MLAPYAMVPAGSALQYEIELIRVAVSPDDLTRVSWRVACYLLAYALCVRGVWGEGAVSAASMIAGVQ